MTVSRPENLHPKLLALYRAGRFPFDRLIKTLAFEQISEAMQASEDGTAVEPVVIV